MKKKKFQKKKNIPFTVKVIAGLVCIFALLLFYLGFGAFTGHHEIGGGIEEIFSIMIIIFAGGFIALGNGLFLGKSWARIAIISVSALFTITGVSMILKAKFEGLIFLVIGGSIGAYFLFNKRVIKAFH